MSFFSTALIAADGTFTYKEFDTITARVANALIRFGHCLHSMVPARQGFVASLATIEILPAEGTAVVVYGGKSYGISTLMFEGDVLSVALQGKLPHIIVQEI